MCALHMNARSAATILLMCLPEKLRQGLLPSFSSVRSSYNKQSAVFMHHVSACFHATGSYAFSYQKVDMRSLTSAMILVHVMHVKARRALTSLHKG